MLERVSTAPGQIASAPFSKVRVIFGAHLNAGNPPFRRVLAKGGAISPLVLWDLYVSAWGQFPLVLSAVQASGTQPPRHPFGSC